MDFSRTNDYKTIDLCRKQEVAEKELCIYILKCEEDKYYVGKSTNINKRLKQHFKKKGASWTKIYKPVQIYEIRRNCDEFDEEKITLQYMKKFGINNVRGGSYTRIQLTIYEINHLVRLIRSCADRCFVCGSKEHFAKHCQKLFCVKCKKNGHLVEECRYYNLNREDILTDKQIEEFIVDSYTDKIYDNKIKISLTNKIKCIKDKIKYSLIKKKKKLFKK